MKKIYLDSKDLISLAEKRTKEFADEFIDVLKKNASFLVYSMHNIMECGASYVVGGNDSTAMKTLNHLECIPHKYIAEAKIHSLELKEAVSAFSEGREFQSIEIPFVPRFDYAVSAFQDPPTAIYINYGLANIIFDLANQDRSLFEGYGILAEKVKQSLKKDRERSNYKAHKKNFSKTLVRDLNLYNIPFSSNKIEELSQWIYQDINRCPGLRLNYEVYHKLLRNLGDAGEDSDIPDLAHISCTPYMDLITLDNRMRGYVEQVDRSIGSNYRSKVMKDLDEVKDALQTSVS